MLRCIMSYACKYGLLKAQDYLLFIRERYCLKGCGRHVQSVRLVQYNLYSAPLRRKSDIHLAEAFCDAPLV